MSKAKSKKKAETCLDNDFHAINSHYDEIMKDFREAIEQRDVKMIKICLFILRTYFHSPDKNKKDLENEEKKFNELVDLSTPILLDWIQGIQDGDKVELYSTSDQTWYIARIDYGISIGEQRKAQVHYEGWDEKFDCMILLHPDTTNPLGTFIEQRQPNRNNKRSYSEVIKEDNVEPSEEKLEQGPVESGTSSNSSSSSSSSSHRVNDDKETSGGRRSRRSSLNVDQSENIKGMGASKKKDGHIKTERKHAKLSNEDKVKFSEWICCKCGQLEDEFGSELVVCDGICLRTFHSNCLQETIAENQEWYCNECTLSQHQCFICKDIGYDYLVRNMSVD